MSEETYQAETIPLVAGETAQRSYLNYAMSVISDRALPDIRDGLKPVHRRVLHAMQTLELGPRSTYKKSARIVGDVIGKYHPHGDSAVYEAMVRMAQSWSMNHPLVDGQGNFGSLDGDSPAAMRYTEARMTHISASLFEDIQKNTVPFEPNFSGELQEPTVLPVRLPLLWVEGTDGIAVGMATKLPPHNLRETANAFLAWLALDEQTDEEQRLQAILEQMPAPDFPTGGIVHNLDGYRDALRYGSGRIRLRGRYVEETRKGSRGRRMVITEIPFQVKKADLHEHIDQLGYEGEIEGIQEVRDESDRDDPVRLVIDLKEGFEPAMVWLQLTALTKLDVSINYNTTVLTPDQRPIQAGIEDVFQAFRDFRIEVIVRRTQYDLDKALERLHLLEGFLRALDQLDATIEQIRGAQDRAEAHEGLKTLLAIDDTQARAILDMRLHRLTGLEREEIQREYETLTERVADLRDILARSERQIEVLRQETEQVRDQFGVDRRSEISEEVQTASRVDLIPNEQVLLIATRHGYIKRVPLQALERQNRGTRGSTGMSLEDGDVVTAMHHANTHDVLLAVTDRGVVHAVHVYDVPERKLRQAGRHYRNIFSGIEGYVVALKSAESLGASESFLLTVSERGKVKRTALSEYTGATRKGGVNGVKIDEGDQIVDARIVSDQGSIVLVSDAAQCIRFPVQEVRPQGRSSRGVQGMRLTGQARVIGLGYLDPQARPEQTYLVCVGRKGAGKKTALEQFSEQSRDGKGVTCFKVSQKTGSLAAAATVHQDDLVLLTKDGGGNRIAFDDVPETGRVTSGVYLISQEVHGILAVPPESQMDSSAEGEWE